MLSRRLHLMEECSQFPRGSRRARDALDSFLLYALAHNVSGRRRIAALTALGSRAVASIRRAFSKQPRKDLPRAVRLRACDSSPSQDFSRPARSDHVTPFGAGTRTRLDHDVSAGVTCVRCSGSGTWIVEEDAPPPFDSLRNGHGTWQPHSCFFSAGPLAVERSGPEAELGATIPSRHEVVTTSLPCCILSEPVTRPGASVALPLVNLLAITPVWYLVWTGVFDLPGWVARTEGPRGRAHQAAPAALGWLWCAISDRRRGRFAPMRYERRSASS
jgi:hypothetical protein